MVAPAYDHLTALVFACVLFVSGVVAVPAISYVNLLYVDQQQLRNVTLEALNSMLFGMGYPSNWGSINPFSESDITKFGLALSESSSFYVLDPDKVQRLNVENPSGSLDYETVRKRLKLQGYGFNIRIMPLFNVAVDEWSLDNYLLFNVNVTLNERGPLPKASVTPTIFYVSGKKDNFNFVTLPETKTNELGECTIPYTLPFEVTGYILVLKVTAADMATVTVPYLAGFAQNVAYASIVGDTVTLNIPGNKSDKNPPERVINNVAVVSPEGAWNYPGVGGRLPEDHMNWGEGFHYWSEDLTGLSYDNPLFLIFNVKVTIGGEGGRQLVLFAASPLFNIASGVLQFGSPSAQSVNTAAIKLCRSVEIAGMTYIFELLLWKEA